MIVVTELEEFPLSMQEQIETDENDTQYEYHGWLESDWLYYKGDLYINGDFNVDLNLIVEGDLIVHGELSNNGYSSLYVTGDVAASGGVAYEFLGVVEGMVVTPAVYLWWAEHNPTLEAFAETLLVIDDSDTDLALSSWPDYCPMLGTDTDESEMLVSELTEEYFDEDGEPIESDISRLYGLYADAIAMAAKGKSPLVSGFPKWEDISKSAQPWWPWAPKKELLEMAGRDADTARKVAARPYPLPLEILEQAWATVTENGKGASRELLAFAHRSDLPVHIKEHLISTELPEVLVALNS
jgi:hypothetical protein